MPRAGGRRCPRARVQAAGAAGGYRSLGGARGAGRAGRARASAPPVRLGAASARSSPVPAVRRAGLSPQAPGGGGEPRAARPRADAARSRSVPEPPPPRAPVSQRRRRARSLARCAPPASPVPPAPRLRPVFLWARQSDGTVQEVRCEDYDPRNRIRITRTPNGWRVIPRTETYDSIVIPKPSPRERTDRRRRRRCGPSRRRRSDLGQSLWPAPDLESHIPSHTIAIPRMQPASPPPPESPLASSPPAACSPPAPPAPPAPEPTPMDNLLAVAELELELQGGSLPAAPYFRPAEEVARDVMSFDLGEPKVPDEIFFDRKAPAAERVAEEDTFAGDLGSHKDLFESISEARYLPELGGPHDEALLESLVEKGCEDNQIHGQALDKLTLLAPLAAGPAPYADDEDDMMLGGAPVADIIDRLPALESPSRSSMTAAQGLLHLHHIADHLPPRDHAQNPVNGYLTAEIFAPETESSAACPLATLGSAPEMRETAEVNRLEYEQDAEKRLQTNGEPADVLFTERVPDLNETYEENEFEASTQNSHRSPERADVDLSAPSARNDNVNVGVADNEVMQERDEIESDEAVRNKDDSLEDRKPDVAALPSIEENLEVPKDLSIMYIEDDGEPRDLTIPRRMATPHASPRRIEIPRAPSIESDTMQSPQPSGIPAMSSPEVFQPPPSKNKTQSILDAMFTSSSPKMYLTSEVSITKQQCEPLNLGKHRKSASPTVSSCSEEKSIKNVGEPLEKRAKRSSMDDLYQITRVLTEKKKKENKFSKKGDHHPVMSALKQFRNLQNNKNFNIPDPLLIPKNRFDAIVMSPGKEIPALLVERPDLRYYDDLDEERERDILVITVKEFEQLLINKNIADQNLESKLTQISDMVGRDTPIHQQPESATARPTSQPRAAPSMGALAEDIEAANSASVNPVLWQYTQQLEAMAACTQNVEFVKALAASGYSISNYADLSQMLLNHPSRLMNHAAGFPMMPHMDYDRVQVALWQEMMLQKAQAERRKSNSTEAQQKEAAAKTTEFQSPYVHSTNKSYQGRSHSSARTSPITNSYSSQRAAMQHPYLQGMYPGMGVRASGPSLPLGGLSVPYFTPGLGGQRAHHKSPRPPSPAPYYANNNYLASLKASEAAAARQPSPSEGPRPRISVKKVDELRRRRDETEVGSTTPLGETPLVPPDSSVPIWHPLFGNQKNYPSPWSWTTVTATGD